MQRAFRTRQFTHGRLLPESALPASIPECSVGHGELEEATVRVPKVQADMCAETQTRSDLHKASSRRWFRRRAVTHLGLFSTIRYGNKDQMRFPPNWSFILRASSVGRGNWNREVQKLFPATYKNRYVFALNHAFDLKPHRST